MTSEATKIILLGRNIKKYREQKGYTQDELAEIMNSDRSYIGKLETANRKPALRYLFRLATALEVTESQLLDFNE
ncbi:MAG: helix-turn-helix domain-containing protein [Fusobacterium sp.]|nr:helix-turn-helix domain-containing protein [Fusobacterium sp.]